MTSNRRRPRPFRPSTPNPEPTPVQVCDELEPGRIGQARGIHGWSRHELAERVGFGVTPARVGQWEFGAARIKPHELLRLAEVTGHPYAFFRRGRPMARLDSGDLFMCNIEEGR